MKRLIALKHLIAIALAALLTWAFLAVLGPVSGAIVRYWASMDAAQQSILKIATPLLCLVPTFVVLYNRRKTKASE